MFILVLQLSLYLLIVLGTYGCADRSGENNPNEINSDTPVQESISVIQPLPLRPHFPDNNTFSESKKELGKLLFWDPILSANQDIACATCHHPSFGFTDSRRSSIGTGGSGLGTERNGRLNSNRNSMTILNTAFNGLKLSDNETPSGTAFMFWDSRSISLEEQIEGPIESKNEMLGRNINSSHFWNI